MLHSILKKTTLSCFHRVLCLGKTALHKTTKRTPNLQETQIALQNIQQTSQKQKITLYNCIYLESA